MRLAGLHATKCRITRAAISTTTPGSTIQGRVSTALLTPFTDRMINGIGLREVSIAALGAAPIGLRLSLGSQQPPA